MPRCGHDRARSKTVDTGRRARPIPDQQPTDIVEGRCRIGERVFSQLGHCRPDGLVVHRLEPLADLGQGQMLALKTANQAQPCEVPFVVLGSGARAPSRAQQPLLDVEVHGPGSDPG